MSTVSWDPKQFYSQAWNVVRRQPKLWIAGLAVATLVVSGSSYQSSGNSSSSRKTASSSAEIRGPVGIMYDAIEPQTPYEIFFYRLRSTFLPSFRQTPLSVYVSLGSELLLIILIAIILGYIGSAWSRGLLIHAVNQATAPTPISLADASKSSIQRLPTVLAIDILPWVRVYLSVIGVIIIFIIAGILKLTGIMIISILGTLLLVGYLILYTVQVVFAQIWAYRLAIIHQYSYTSAMNTGRLMSRNNKGNMLVLGFINIIGSGIISGILLAIMGSGAIVSIISFIFNPSIQTILTAIIVSLITLFFAFPILKLKDGLIQSFIYTVWNHAYAVVCAAHQSSGEFQNEINPHS